MTVRELVAVLRAYSDDDLVVMAQDNDAAGILPLIAVSADRFLRGSLLLRVLTPALQRQGYSLWDVGCPAEGAVDCVTLWPWPAPRQAQ